MRTVRDGEGLSGVLKHEYQRDRGPVKVQGSRGIHAFFLGEGGDVSYKIQEYKFIVTQMLQSASYLYVPLLLSRALSFY